MEQIIFYLREYAEVIPVAIGGFAAILLLVTLHRIKRIEKYIREATGNTRAARRERRRQKKQRGQALVSEEKNTIAGQLGVGSGTVAAAAIADMSKTGMGSTKDAAFAQEQKGHAVDHKVPEDPTELIDAVLEEVFL